MFVLKQVAEHGTENPIVARLSYQTLTLLKATTLSEDQQGDLFRIYQETLQPNLLRCHEIEERFKSGFNEGVKSYNRPTKGTRVVNIPQVPRLAEECQNFLYAAKGYLRGVIKVFNILYGTTFDEPSEFTQRSKKHGRPSLLDHAEASFGKDHPTTEFLQRMAPMVNDLIWARNAVEHPGGLSGEMHFANFELEQDGRICEPCWRREKDGVAVYGPTSIADALQVAVANLLTLGEDVFVSWAIDNLQDPEVFELVQVSPEHQDPKNPVRWVRQPSATFLKAILGEQ